MGYAQSPIQDSESSLRIVVGSDRDDIQFILKQYITNFVAYKLVPGNYTIKDLSEAFYSMADHGETPQIEYDNVTMKSKFILTRFSSTFGTLRFDEKSFFCYFFRFYNILGI